MRSVDLALSESIYTNATLANKNQSKTNGKNIKALKKIAD